MEVTLKQLFTFFISILIFSNCVLSQTVINGSFEDNNTNQCLYNLPNLDYNANMNNSIGFGPADQLDILGTACSYGQPQDGSWFVGVSVSDILENDALSLELSSSLVMGNSYTLKYYDKKASSYEANILEIGISNQPDDFGNFIYTSPPATAPWTERTITFTADIDANYITVRAIPNAYGWTHIDNFSLEPTTSIQVENTPTQYSLGQNFPNPFNPSTTIKYQIEELSYVLISVYDVLGNQVATLVNEEKPAGNYKLEFDATGLKSGVYFYKLQAGNFIQTKKMVLMK